MRSGGSPPLLISAIIDDSRGNTPAGFHSPPQDRAKENPDDDPKAPRRAVSFAATQGALPYRPIIHEFGHPFGTPFWLASGREIEFPCRRISVRKYILKRLVISVITIWLIATASFFLLRTLPGNPFASEQLLSMDMQERMMHYYGLDRPLFEQYLTFMKNLLHGDFGYSLKYVGQSVNGIISEKFPTSAHLGLQAYLLSFPLGVLLGVAAARRRGRPIDYALVAFSVLGVSVPVFVLASLLQYVFAIRLGWFPVARWGTLAQTVLPTITLAMGAIASKTRIMRTLMLEVLTEDYVKTAKAKGLSKRRIIWNHEVRNAIIPLIPSLGMEIVSILMGSFVVEKIYAIPGIGAFFVTSVQTLDYTMTLGLTVFFGVFVVTANFIIDLIYGLVDPRIRITR